MAEYLAAKLLNALLSADQQAATKGADVRAEVLQEHCDARGIETPMVDADNVNPEVYGQFCDWRDKSAEYRRADGALKRFRDSSYGQWFDDVAVGWAQGQWVRTPWQLEDYAQQRVDHINLCAAHSAAGFWTATDRHVVTAVEHLATAARNAGIPRVGPGPNPTNRAALDYANGLIEDSRKMAGEADQRRPATATHADVDSDAHHLAAKWMSADLTRKWLFGWSGAVQFNEHERDWGRFNECFGEVWSRSTTSPATPQQMYNWLLIEVDGLRQLQEEVAGNRSAWTTMAGEGSLLNVTRAIELAQTVGVIVGDMPHQAMTFAQEFAELYKIAGKVRLAYPGIVADVPQPRLTGGSTLVTTDPQPLSPREDRPTEAGDVTTTPTQYMTPAEYVVKYGGNVDHVTRCFNKRKIAGAAKGADGFWRAPTSSCAEHAATCLPRRRRTSADGENDPGHWWLCRHGHWTKSILQPRCGADGCPDKEPVRQPGKRPPAQAPAQHPARKK